MSTITIDLNELRTLLTRVIPFAGTDNGLPVLHSVLLRTHGEHLVATATDRYVIGMARTKLDQPAAFEALVKLRDIRHVLATFKPRKGTQARITLQVAGAVGNKSLTVSLADGLFADADDLTARYSLIDGQFPNVAGIFSDPARNSTEHQLTGYNPQYLAKFQHVMAHRGEPIRVNPGAASKPTIVQAGDYFLGAIMPVRLVDDRGISDLSVWNDMLQPPKPKTVSKSAAKRTATKTAAAAPKRRATTRKKTAA